MNSMNRQEIERLRSIRTFPSLVKYLRDELDWPIDSDDYDDLTFDYQPEELGLDSETAVRIKEIKQLRPLVTGQQWGIFFINFEPKRLPVVVLRRILQKLVIKKRASANKSQMPTWNLHDLLFISTCGESNERSLTFAHFSEDPNTGELPTLRVLGWDDQDTVLHLDHAHITLKAKLSWPDNPDDIQGWRNQWSEAFTLRVREVITTSKDLAIRLSALAARIRKRVNAILRVESEKGPFTQLRQAFKEALIHDLNEDDFADMYAQTITYGLLAARVSRPMGVVTENLAQLVSNPFLKETLSTFLTFGGKRGKVDFDEAGILDVVELLNSPDTNIDAVLQDFGNRTQREDPVIHFYELFLTEYDKKKKVERGVFYTPQPIVSYIVQSVHELLQTEFGLEDGLASTITWGEMAKRNKEIKLPQGASTEEPFVQVLDPAVGTGTFLVEVIDIIAKAMIGKWERAGRTQNEIQRLWDDYVGKHLLPRLYGYELMMAPYVISDIKLTLKLTEISRQLGELFYHAGGKGRYNIYLTNSLEPPSHVADEKLADLFLPLAHEAAAVNRVKREKRFTVVIGNPPYSNFGQLNKIPFILELLEDYKRGLDEKKLNLDDDFIKFVRFGQYQLERTGIGTLGFITNNVYSDGVTHRQMRQSLMKTFQDIRFLDLHGNSKRKEQAPDGTKDENVFDITIGVGILLLTRGSLSDKNLPSVVHGELWGKRSAKYDALLKGDAGKTHWAKLTPTLPYCFFVPKDFANLGEYQAGIAIQEVFPVFSSGIQTKRDTVAIAEAKETLLATLKDFARLSARELRNRYALPKDGRDWKIEWASAHAKEILRSPKALAPILYRPFDSRWTVMDSRSKGFVAYPRYDVMSQMAQNNLGLIVTRQLSLPTFQHVFATRQLIDGNTISLQTREYNYLFPLYLHSEHGLQGSLAFDTPGKINVGSGFLKRLAARMNSPLRVNGLPKSLAPEDIFYYAYAVLHSPGYRQRYAEFLKIDFPRLPLTSSLDLFRELARVGGELVALHLVEAPELAKHITKFVGTGLELEKVSYSNNTVWIDKGQSCGFKGVPENVWDFHIGGYRVCEKWLKDRKGRTLTKGNIEHYHRIVVALSETIRLVKEIDEVIGAHGGWPGAFQSARKEEESENLFRKVAEPPAEYKLYKAKGKT